MADTLVARPEPRARRAAGWSPALRMLMVGSIAIPLLLLLLWGERSWRIGEARAAEEARRNAELVREFALGVVRTQEAVLGHAADIAATVEGEGADGAVLHERLAALDAQTASVLSIVIVSPDGEIVASSRTHPVRIDVSDRSYFRELRDAQPADTGIRLDRLRLRPAGQDVIVASRRRPGPGFQGIVLSTIPVEAFTDFFGRIAADSHASASLLREDGLLLLRHDPDAPPVMLPPEVPSRQAIARADSGLYEAYALSDGVTRLYGYAKVADLPLYANFGVPLSTVRQTWLRGLLPVGGLLALAALLGCAAVLQAVQGVRAEVDRGLLEEARRRAEYQETLLRELHHRVKNSLMTVQALVRIRGGNTGADKVLQQRIMALGQVHDLLHVSEFVSRLDLSAFLRALCANPAVAPPEGGVTVHCDTDPVEVGVEQAVPLSLIVVELLTNALKHAFPSGRAGRITIGLRHIGDHACLSLRDDGVGLPPATQHGRRSGLWLVERLVGQIQGHLEIRRQGGTEFRLTFPLRLDQPPDAVGTGA
ncbi:hypothetical protein J8J14_02315 [Roseomonas sp. SSH11]|uniref:histidine kinase n=1 Tax=Pararoseomonas baculiformis TaxID=2820812 RepID=A0ABS4A9C5_9PROT|nr:hypothetical protein [Pararoseomonas baculiformis]